MSLRPAAFVSPPLASLSVAMGVLVDLTAWREEREPEARMLRAVEGLEAVLAGREGDAPDWLVTELYAAVGCRSLGMTDEAARRVEGATERMRKEIRREQRRLRRERAARLEDRFRAETGRGSGGK